MASEHVPTDNNLCLVSQLIVKDSKNESQVHPYPEFYASSLSNFTENNFHHNCSNIFEVEGQERDSLKGLLKSPRDIKGKKICVFGLCPLVHDNVASSWNIVDWNFSADAICKLGKHLRIDPRYDSFELSKVAVNVIVFGGKLTKLISTFSCLTNYITHKISLVLYNRFDDRRSRSYRSMLFIRIYVV